MLFGLELGTVAGWVTAVGVTGMLGVLLKFLPRWVEVKAAERVSDHAIAKQLRDELMSELDECRNNHQILHQENLALTERVMLLEDGDRRKTIALTLVMNELVRLDPTSEIILRAKGVLELGITLGTPFDEKIERAINRLGEKE